MTRPSKARIFLQRSSLALALSSGSACGDDDVSVDGGTPLRDGGASDGGAIDAAASDSGASDTGTSDGGGERDAHVESDAAIGEDAGDIGSCEHSLADLAGGWSNRDLFACFDGTAMWIGDSRSKLDGAAPCTVLEAGCGFRCTDPDGGSFDGTLVVDGDALNAEVTDCGGSPDECVAAFTRDPTILCGR
jgi:hypothetical protein